MPRIASVLLPLPTQKPYRYLVPAALADRVVTGARVVVPVRGRELIGGVESAVEGGAEEPDSPELKSILLAPDPAPLVPGALLALARWMARYYAAPPGLALRAMLPGPLWGQSRLVATVREASAVPGGTSRPVFDALVRAGGSAPATTLGRRLKRPVWDALQRLERAGAIALSTEAPEFGPRAGIERVVTITRVLPVLAEREAMFGRATRQRDAYEALDRLGGEATLTHMVRQLGFSRAVLTALVERGVAGIEDRERLRDPFAGLAEDPAPPPAPTAGQGAAIEALRDLPAGGGGLLFGVTGSGKTLVYLEAVRAALLSGRGAIVLVPEIALTPQTIARVRGAFGDEVAVLHSALSDGERADAWRALAGGQRRVVVGARSAVFAPVRNLGMLVVDEEHDASYKNGETPRYDARRVAMTRARLEGARVLLASATPSLETWAAREALRMVELPERIGARPMPPVRLVDLRHADLVREAAPVPWSAVLDAAVEARLAAGDQVLLLLNRRGWAHFLQCASCGDVLECPHCAIALTVHRQPDRLRCHYCGYHASPPAACPACGHAIQRARGIGTQQLERWLSGRYPGARLARMDADTTTGRWSHARILDAVRRREVDILFGTQMIAKGLDFPDVTLVGVVNADTGLHLPDFRAAERTFQLVAQVAGRAGRGPRGGEVLVQTRSPEHHALVTAARHDHRAFAEAELAMRATPAWPPHVQVTNVVLSGPREPRVGQAAADLADWFRALVTDRALPVEVLGPAPAPLARIKDRWRWHIVLRSGHRTVLGKVIRYAQRRAASVVPKDVRLVLDRDPVSLL